MAYGLASGVQTNQETLKSTVADQQNTDGRMGCRKVAVIAESVIDPFSDMTTASSHKSVDRCPPDMKSDSDTKGYKSILSVRPKTKPDSVKTVKRVRFEDHDPPFGVSLGRTSHTVRSDDPLDKGKEQDSVEMSAMELFYPGTDPDENANLMQQEKEKREADNNSPSGSNEPVTLEKTDDHSEYYQYLHKIEVCKKISRYFTYSDQLLFSSKPGWKGLFAEKVMELKSNKDWKKSRKNPVSRTREAIRDIVKHCFDLNLDNGTARRIVKAKLTDDDFANKLQKDVVQEIINKTSSSSGTQSKETSAPEPPEATEK